MDATNDCFIIMEKHSTIIQDFSYTKSDCETCFVSIFLSFHTLILSIWAKNHCKRIFFFFFTFLSTRQHIHIHITTFFFSVHWTNDRTYNVDLFLFLFSIDLSRTINLNLRKRKIQFSMRIHCIIYGKHEVGREDEAILCQ